MPHIVVAGAGIAGLSTALALAACGAQVTVLERRTVLDEVGAGLQLSPNATRWLSRWGVLDALTAVATLPQAVRIRRGRDGADLARMRLGTDATQLYGAPFLLVHRADLQRVLLDAAGRHPNVAVQLGVDAGAIAGSTGILVEGRAGADTVGVTADGYVDAGGLHTAWGSPDQAPRFSGRLAWRTLIAADRLPAAFVAPESNLWLGPKTHLVHYPLRGGTIVNVVAITEQPARGSDQGDPWARTGDSAILQQVFAAWHRDALGLIEAAPAWRTWPLFEGVSGTPWSDRARTAVGDAAHPMLPFLAQGASQAVEDAGMLAEAVAGEANDLTAAFRAYEARRRPRAERVQKTSNQQGRIYHLGGPAALARDLAMRALGPRRMLSRLNWLYGEGPAPSA